MTPTSQVSYTQQFQSDNLAKLYDEHEYSEKSYSMYIWHIEKEYLDNSVKKFTENKNNLKYLDFACGTARVISYLEKYMDFSLGVDISEKMILLGKPKVKKSTLIKRDIIAEPLNEKFDVITSFRFFLNAENSLRYNIINSLRNLMDEKSVFIFSIQGNTFSFRGVVNLIYRIFNKKFNQMSFGDVKKMLDDSNFKIIDFRGIGICPQILYKISGLRSIAHIIDKVCFRLNIFNYFSNNLMFIVKKK